MKKQANYPQLLSRLFTLVNNGKAEIALEETQRQLSLAPGDPNLLHLAAIANTALGNDSQALPYFQKSLHIAPNQPQALNNLANLLIKMGEAKEAKVHLKQAISLAPEFIEAKLSLANLEFEQHAYEKAGDIAQSAIKNDKNNLTALTLLGNVYRKIDKFSDAVEYFERALSIQPEYLPAMYGLAITFSAMDLNDQALPLLEKAHQIRPAATEISYSLALTQLNLGQFERAETTLKSLIKDNPLHIEAHRTLNELFWQQGNKHAFCTSYLLVPATAKENTQLTISHIETLIAAGELKAAEDVLQSTGPKSPNPNIQFLRARIAEERNDFKSAAKLYETAYAQLPTAPVAKQLIITLIKSQRFEEAEKLLEQFLPHYPDDQLLWALQGTCWKMTSNEKYQWLTQQNTLIREFIIPTPKGYSSLETFLEELKNRLIEIHSFKSQPLNQSVRKGAQTPGRLLYKKDPVIQDLKTSLTEVVHQYIQSMPTDLTHPFLRRKTPEFSFSGSWSVLLQEGGHHVSHVHPAGWISSAFYVAVPPTNTKVSNTCGDIYFGQSPYDLGERDKVELLFKPSPGKLVLFPSFTWHGTIPLPKSENALLRLTTPFDVTPRI